MISSTGTLQIFDDFRVDRTLPKHQRRPSPGAMSKSDWASDDEEMMEGSDIWPPTQSASFSTPASFRRVINVNGSLRVSDVGMDNDGHLAIQLDSWWRRPLRWLVALFAPKKPAQDPVSEPTPELTIPEFFAAVARTTSELELSAARARGFELALESARKGGQKALEEQLREGVAIDRAETQLVSVGLNRYLTEAALVEFVRKCPKGLCLAWISNFTRVVPEDVLSKKVLADNRKIFDNYVVLHYDPERKAWAETEAEKRARKDPILFGVLKGSRKLYFVGDWVDEFCDLTLEQIANALGTPASELDMATFGPPV